MKHALSNKSVNYINLHSGLQVFADAMGNIFLAIYLYKIGIPLYVVYLTLVGSFFLRLCTRIFALKLCYKAGLRKTVVLGTLSYSTLYIFLGMVDGVNIWLFVFIFVAAITDILYWLGYHTYYSLLGDIEHRGKQIGIREGATFLAKFLAPIVGGLLINYFGFWSAFIASSICMLIAVIPLLRIPDIPLETISFQQARQQISRSGLFLYTGDAMNFFAHLFTWPIVLFLMLNDYIQFGALLSLAVLFQIIGSYLIGHAFDSGNGKKIYPIGIAIVVFVVLGRVFIADSIPSIILLDVFYMIGFLLYANIMHSALYNVSKKSPNPLWFHYFCETGWDIGGIITCTLVAGLLFAGIELKYVMLLAIIGLSIISLFLKRYYSKS